MTSAKCPKCGLVQMARPTCKACGAALGSPQANPTRPSQPDSPTAPDPRTLAKDAISASPSSPRIVVTITPGLLIGSALVLGVLLWLGVQWGRRPTQPTSVQPTQGGSTGVASPAKPLPKVKPRLSEAERRAASEALQAVKALHSVTTAGVNYNEYLRRVLDAKIQVDRYTQAEGGDEEVKGRMREAMALYVFAKDAWSVRISERSARGYDDLAGRPEVGLCPQLKEDIEEWMRRPDRSGREEADRGFKIAYSQPRLWQCASERVAEIDQVLRTRS